jgi:hypothetical protein
MDLLIMKLPRGLTQRVSSGVEWWSCEDVLAVFPRAGAYADGILDAFAHDDNLTIRAPLACLMAAVAHQISTYTYESDESELDEPTTEYDTTCSACQRARARSRHRRRPSRTRACRG